MSYNYVLPKNPYMGFPHISATWDFASIHIDQGNRAIQEKWDLLQLLKNSIAHCKQIDRDVACKHLLEKQVFKKENTAREAFVLGEPNFTQKIVRFVLNCERSEGVIGVVGSIILNFLFHIVTGLMFFTFVLTPLSFALMVEYDRQTGENRVKGELAKLDLDIQNTRDLARKIYFMQPQEFNLWKSGEGIEWINDTRLGPKMLDPSAPHAEQVFAPSAPGEFD